MYIVDTRFISYWYFLDEVTGPSATEGFFEEGEAFRTQIMTFESNSVHSNGHTGFLFGSELQPDQDFNGGTSNGGTEKCNPREHPKDPNSEPGPKHLLLLWHISVKKFQISKGALMVNFLEWIDSLRCWPKWEEEE